MLPFKKEEQGAFLRRSVSAAAAVFLVALSSACSSHGAQNVLPATSGHHGTAAITGEAAYPSGTAWSIPGVIAFDNYDLGGQGVGYGTKLTNNPGGQYRPADAVGIQNDNDAGYGNGYDIGWLDNGNWFKYSVNVQSAALYPIALRVAANGNGSLHIEDENGTNLTGAVAIAASGGYQSWTTVTTSATLNAGAHILKVVIDQNGFNLNQMALGTPVTSAPGATPTVAPTPAPTAAPISTSTPAIGAKGESAYPNGVPWTIPGIISFDNYDLGGVNVGWYTPRTSNPGGQYRNDGVGIENDNDPGYGNGYDVGWNDPGDWYKYTVNVQSTAAYHLKARVASGREIATGQGSGSFHIEDETGTNLTGEIAVPFTNGFQSWTTVTGSIALNAGTHVLKAVVDSGNGTFNFDAMAIGSVQFGPTGIAQSLPAGLQLPSGFTGVQISTGAAREMVFLPNGDLLVGTPYQTVQLIPNAEGDTPGQAHNFISLPDQNADGVAYGSDGNIYIGTMHYLWKIPYTTGQQSADPSTAQIVATFRQGAIVGTDQHNDTSMAIAGSMIYFGVGSSCDECVESDPTRATIQSIPLGGGPMTTVAVHIRNPLAMTINPNTGTLWAGGPGQDGLAWTDNHQIGHPYEYMDPVTLHGGTADYGWPYCEENNQAFLGASALQCANTVAPRVEMPAFSTHIGAAFYPAHPTGAHVFPSQYWGGLFVGSHGSWHCCPSTTPKVEFVPMNGDTPVTAVNWSNPIVQWSTFLYDTATSTASTSYVERFTGVAVGPQGSLFIGGNATNQGVYRIRPL